MPGNRIAQLRRDGWAATDPRPCRRLVACILPPLRPPPADRPAARAARSAGTLATSRRAGQRPGRPAGPIAVGDGAPRRGCGSRRRRDAGPHRDASPPVRRRTRARLCAGRRGTNSVWTKTAGPAVGAAVRYASFRSSTTRSRIPVAAGDGLDAVRAGPARRGSDAIRLTKFKLTLPRNRPFRATVSENPTGTSGCGAASVAGPRIVVHRRRGPRTTRAAALPAYAAGRGPAVRRLPARTASPSPAGNPAATQGTTRERPDERIRLQEF